MRDKQNSIRYRSPVTVGIRRSLLKSIVRSEAQRLPSLLPSREFSPAIPSLFIRKVSTPPRQCFCPNVMFIVALDFDLSTNYFEYSLHSSNSLPGINTGQHHYVFLFFTIFFVVFQYSMWYNYLWGTPKTVSGSPFAKMISFWELPVLSEVIHMENTAKDK